MRVLLVEDDPALLESLSWGLRAEGYVVDTAADGQDGLWRAREEAHDVIVLDVMLPKLNGYQVCEALRERGIWTPILMLTAMDDELDHAEGLDSGADDYLVKPFSYPVLLAHLRALTRRGLAERPAALTVADLSLDPASRAVTRRGQPVDLTGRETALLEYLLRHQGTVVSKSELLHHCWDSAHDGPLSVVEVQIHRLRRKLEGAGDGPLITTVRGGGYLIPHDDPSHPQTDAYGDVRDVRPGR